jgi:hypothetical protein
LRVRNSPNALLAIRNAMVVPAVEASDPPTRALNRRLHKSLERLRPVSSLRRPKVEKTIAARGYDPVSGDEAINCGSVSHESFK